MVSLEEALAVFEEPETTQSTSEMSRRVAPAELQRFLNSLEGTKIKDEDARKAAVTHFGHKIIERQWRDAWEKFPRRRQRGENDQTLRKYEP